jgi:hypothetical protein
MGRFVFAIGLLASMIGLGVWTDMARTGPPEKNEGVRRTAVDNERHGPAKPKAAAVADAASSQQQAKMVRAILERRITFESAPNMPVQDAVEVLENKGGLQIIIDDPLYTRDPVLAERYPEGVSKCAIRVPTKITDVRLGHVLQLVLTPFDSTFVIRDGSVFIVPEEYVTSGKVLHQLVDVAFENTPLEDALGTLSARTGATIVLDRRSGLAAAPVTATFSEVPLESAVRLLTDMCDSRVVRVGNALYVTSLDNARALQKELDRQVAPQTQSNKSKDVVDAKKSR